MNAIPKEEEDGVFSKQDVRDSVRLRLSFLVRCIVLYTCFVIVNVFMYSMLGNAVYSYTEAVSLMRHDILRGFFTALLAKVCHGVIAEQGLYSVLYYLQWEFY